MPNKSTATPAPAAPPRAPVVFLNPNVLTVASRVVLEQPNRNPQPGVVSVRDGPGQALKQLLDMAGATLVCTDRLVNGRDPMNDLVERGLRGHQFAPGWFVQPERQARGHAVEAWLRSHDARPAIVIDRAPTIESSVAVGEGARIIVVTIAETAELTNEVCRQALAMLRKPAA